MRQYATVEEYQNWAGNEADPRVDDAMLERASGVVDDMLLGVPYPVDEQLMPAHPIHVAALRSATCAQAQWFVEIGDMSGAGAYLGGASIGSVQLPHRARDHQSIQDSRHAPEALQTLRAAGLLNRVVNH